MSNSASPPLVLIVLHVLKDLRYGESKQECRDRSVVGYAADDGKMDIMT
jgi:hypothetical protein